MNRTKFLALASFFATFSLTFTGALADQLNSYSIDADLTKEGTSNIRLILTFSDPTSKFDFLFPFKITNFTATSSAGPVLCDNRLEGVSLISCDMNLTQDKKTLEIAFQSQDMIKPSQSGSVFTSDFSIKIPAKEVFTAVRLPEGMVLREDVPGGATVPFSNTTSTDGRRIIVLWRFSNVVQKPLSFQVFYEQVTENIAPAFGVPPLRVLVLLAIIFGGGIGLIVLRRRKKTQEVVFSVLDDYEKRVISSIEKEGGTANQKKVVIDTNLSKAKVSRVVQKLVERGLIEVERRGRTNIIRFVKKKFGS